MTDRFVRSGAAGAGTGVDWANAFTTLTAANTASAAGDRFWIADDHNESTAGAVTLTSKGTAASPSFYYCVDHTVASPGTGDLKTTGSIATTGANNITMAGVAYFYGLKLTAGNAASSASVVLTSAAGNYLILDTCALALGGSGGGGINIGVAGAGATVDFINTTVKFAATTQSIALRNSSLRWRNTVSAVDASGAVPTTLFVQSGGICKFMVCEGVDFSLVTGTLIAGASFPDAFTATFIDCKVGSGVTLSTTPANPGGKFDFVYCDSAATNYQQARFLYEGTLTQETTIVRSGGASDGTTPLSHKIVTTANAKWAIPFESFPIAIWNNTVGSSVTATVEIVAAGALNNDDVWLEVEYLGSASSPLASLATSTKANNLATGTALTASGATWASSPGSAQTLSVTFTPQQAGDIRCVVKVGKASQTIYVDPKVTLSPAPTSGQRDRLIAPGVFVNPLVGGGLLTHPGMAGGARG